MSADSWDTGAYDWRAVGRIADVELNPLDALFWVLSAAAAFALPVGGERRVTRGVSALASEA